MFSHVVIVDIAEIKSSLSSIQSAAARLDHVDEVSQGLLLYHGDSLEVPDQRVR